MKLIKPLLYLGASCISLIMILLIATDLSNTQTHFETKETSIQTDKQEITSNPKNYKKVINDYQAPKKLIQVAAATSTKKSSASITKTNLLSTHEAAHFSVVNLNNTGLSMMHATRNNTQFVAHNNQIDFKQFRAEADIPFNIQQDINPKSFIDIGGDGGLGDGGTAPLSDALPLLILFVGIYAGVLYKKKQIS